MQPLGYAWHRLVLQVSLCLSVCLHACLLAFLRGDRLTVLTWFSSPPFSSPRLGLPFTAVALARNSLAPYVDILDPAAPSAASASSAAAAATFADRVYLPGNNLISNASASAAFFSRPGGGGGRRWGRGSVSFLSASEARLKDARSGGGLLMHKHRVQEFSLSALGNNSSNNAPPRGIDANGPRTAAANAPASSSSSSRLDGSGSSGGAEEVDPEAEAAAAGAEVRSLLSTSGADEHVLQLTFDVTSLLPAGHPYAQFLQQQQQGGGGGGRHVRPPGAFRSC